MIGAISLTQTALARLFEAHMPAPEALRRRWRERCCWFSSVFLLGYLCSARDVNAFAGAR
jgi:hypothetical protein